MRYFQSSQRDGSNVLEMRRELAKLLKVLDDMNPDVSEMRREDHLFWLNMKEFAKDSTFTPTRKQIFWLRDIKDKAL